MLNVDGFFKSLEAGNVSIEQLKDAYREAKARYTEILDYYSGIYRFNGGVQAARAAAGTMMRRFLLSDYRGAACPVPDGFDLDAAVMAQTKQDMKDFLDKFGPCNKMARVIEGRYPTKEELKAWPRYRDTAKLAKDNVPVSPSTSGQTVHIKVRGWIEADWTGTDADSIKFLKQINAMKMAEIEKMGIRVTISDLALTISITTSRQMLL